MTEDKPLRNRSVLCKRMGQETVLYDQESETIHVLNPTALLICDLCDGEHSVEDMEKAIRNEFSASDEQMVSQDIQGVIDRFFEEGLLEKG